MSPNEKIDKIFQMVSEIKTDVALIKQRDTQTEEKLNSHAGKILAIEQFMEGYRIQKARIAGIVIASGTIFSFIGALIWKAADYLFKR